MRYASRKPHSIRCKRRPAYEEEYTAKKNPKAAQKLDDNSIRHLSRMTRLTVGLDLGDRTSRYCILNAEGEVVSEGSVATTQI